MGRGEASAWLLAQSLLAGALNLKFLFETCVFLEIEAFCPIIIVVMVIIVIMVIVIAIAIVMVIVIIVVIIIIMMMMITTTATIIEFENNDTCQLPFVFSSQSSLEEFRSIPSQTQPWGKRCAQVLHV